MIWLTNEREDQSRMICPSCNRLAQFHDIIENRGRISCRHCQMSGRSSKWRPVGADIGSFIKGDDYSMLFFDAPKGFCA